MRWRTALWVGLFRPAIESSTNQPTTRNIAYTVDVDPALTTPAGQAITRAISFTNLTPGILTGTAANVEIRTKTRELRPLSRRSSSRSKSLRVPRTAWLAWPPRLPPGSAHRHRQHLEHRSLHHTNQHRAKRVTHSWHDYRARPASGVDDHATDECSGSTDLADDNIPVW